MMRFLLLLSVLLPALAHKFVLLDSPLNACNPPATTLTSTIDPEDKCSMCRKLIGGVLSNLADQASVASIDLPNKDPFNDENGFDYCERLEKAASTVELDDEADTDADDGDDLSKSTDWASLYQMCVALRDELIGMTLPTGMTDAQICTKAGCTCGDSPAEYPVPEWDGALEGLVELFGEDEDDSVIQTEQAPFEVDFDNVGDLSWTTPTPDGRPQQLLDSVTAGQDVSLLSVAETQRHHRLHHRLKQRRHHHRHHHAQAQATDSQYTNQQVAAMLQTVQNAMQTKQHAAVHQATELLNAIGKQKLDAATQGALDNFKTVHRNLWRECAQRCVQIVTDQQKWSMESQLEKEISLAIDQAEKGSAVDDTPLTVDEKALMLQQLVIDYQAAVEAFGAKLGHALADNDGVFVVVEKLVWRMYQLFKRSAVATENGRPTDVSTDWKGTSPRVQPQGPVKADPLFPNVKPSPLCFPGERADFTSESDIMLMLSSTVDDFNKPVGTPIGQNIREMLTMSLQVLKGDAKVWFPDIINGALDLDQSDLDNWLNARQDWIDRTLFVPATNNDACSSYSRAGHNPDGWNFFSTICPALLGPVGSFAGKPQEVVKQVSDKERLARENSRRQRPLNTRSISPPLSDTEIQWLFAAGVKDSTQLSRLRANVQFRYLPLPWTSSATTTDVMNDNLAGTSWNFQKDANAYGMTALTGPSKITGMYMNLGRFLGLSPDEMYFLRLAMLAWLVPIKENSIHEVMVAAEPFGLNYKEWLATSSDVSNDPFKLTSFWRKYLLPRKAGDADYTVSRTDISRAQLKSQILQGAKAFPDIVLTPEHILRRKAQLRGQAANFPSWRRDVPLLGNVDAYPNIFIQKKSDVYVMTGAAASVSLNTDQSKVQERNYRITLFGGRLYWKEVTEKVKDNGPQALALPDRSNGESLDLVNDVQDITPFGKTGRKVALVLQKSFSQQLFTLKKGGLLKKDTAVPTTQIVLKFSDVWMPKWLDELNKAKAQTPLPTCDSMVVHSPDLDELTYDSPKVPVAQLVTDFCKQTLKKDFNSVPLDSLGRFTQEVLCTDLFQKKNPNTQQLAELAFTSVPKDKSQAMGQYLVDVTDGQTLANSLVLLGELALRLAIHVDSYRYQANYVPASLEADLKAVLSFRNVDTFSRVKWANLAQQFTRPLGESSVIYVTGGTSSDFPLLFSQPEVELSDNLQASLQNVVVGAVTNNKELPVVFQIIYSSSARDLTPMGAAQHGRAYPIAGTYNIVSRTVLSCKPDGGAICIWVTLSQQPTPPTPVVLRPELNPALNPLPNNWVDGFIKPWVSSLWEYMQSSRPKNQYSLKPVDFYGILSPQFGPDLAALVVMVGQDDSYLVYKNFRSVAQSVPKFFFKNQELSDAADFSGNVQRAIDAICQQVTCKKSDVSTISSISTPLEYYDLKTLLNTPAVLKVMQQLAVMRTVICWTKSAKSLRKEFGNTMITSLANLVLTHPELAYLPYNDGRPYYRTAVAKFYSNNAADDNVASTLFATNNYVQEDYEADMESATYDEAVAMAFSKPQLTQTPFILEVLGDTKAVDISRVSCDKAELLVPEVVYQVTGNNPIREYDSNHPFEMIKQKFTFNKKDDDEILVATELEGFALFDEWSRFEDRMEGISAECPSRPSTLTQFRNRDKNYKSRAKKPATIGFYTRVTVQPVDKKLSSPSGVSKFPYVLPAYYWDSNGAPITVVN